MINRIVFIAVLIFTFQFVYAQEKNLIKQIDVELNKAISSKVILYKHLHENPELSFREKETSKLLSEKLKSLGFEIIENIGGYGFAGVLKNGEGPVIMYRTDLDALPILEKTGVSYASCKTDTLNGLETAVMHACGHDMHMTVFVGVAELMSKMKNKWSGTLVMLGQPAEELGGSAVLLENDLFKKIPTPSLALAYHVSPELEAGKIGYIPGPAWAKVNTVEITVHGHGGHGAYPHQAIDPIVLSARIILALQTIVSREISPLNPAVVTVGAIQGGKKHNVIPDDVHMMLTLRSYSDEVSARMISSIKRICNGIAASAGLSESECPTVVEIHKSLPPGINNPELTEKIAKMLKQEFGETAILKQEPSMGGEDFFAYGSTAENVTLCMLRLGSVSKETIEKHKKEGTSLPGLHSSYYAPVPEKTINMGVKAMTLAIIKLFEDGESIINK